VQTYPPIVLLYRAFTYIALILAVAEVYGRYVAPGGSFHTLGFSFSWQARDDGGDGGDGGLRFVSGGPTYSQETSRKPLRMLWWWPASQLSLWTAPLAKCCCTADPALVRERG
jgi:hypothetical protein